MNDFSSSFWDRKGSNSLVGDIVGRPEAIALLGDIQGQDVLDAGCGTGFVSQILLERGATIYGLDNDSDAVRIASGKGGGTYRQGQVEAMPYRDGAFDAIICVSVLCYLTEEIVARAYEEMFRVAKPKGRIVVSVPHPSLYIAGSIARRCDRPHRWLHLIPEDEGETKFKGFYYNRADQCAEIHLRAHPASAYINLGIASGLRIQKIREICFPESLACQQWGEEWGYPVYLTLLFDRS